MYEKKRASIATNKASKHSDEKKKQAHRLQKATKENSDKMQ